jgi:hypothetical protein
MIDGECVAAFIPAATEPRSNEPTCWGLAAIALKCSESEEGGGGQLNDERSRNETTQRKSVKENKEEANSGFNGVMTHKRR